MNHTLERLVADDSECTKVMARVGSCSGKMWVLVHRIACLVRVRRKNLQGILALTNNRVAAVEARRPPTTVSNL